MVRKVSWILRILASTCCSTWLLPCVNVKRCASDIRSDRFVSDRCQLLTNTAIGSQALLWSSHVIPSECHSDTLIQVWVYWKNPSFHFVAIRWFRVDLYILNISHWPSPTAYSGTYWFSCDDTMIHFPTQTADSNSFITQTWLQKQVTSLWFWPVYVRVLWHVTAVPAGLWTQASRRVWSLNRALVLLLF